MKVVNVWVIGKPHRLAIFLGWFQREWGKNEIGCILTPLDLSLGIEYPSERKFNGRCSTIQAGNWSWILQNKKSEFSEWRFYFDDEIKKNRHPFLRVEMWKQSQTVQVFRLLKSLQRAEGLFFHLWKGSVCPKQIVRNWMATRHRSYSGFKLCTVFTIFN